MIYRVHDVLNYGGFFAGDTVTLTAHAVGAQPPVGSPVERAAVTNAGSVGPADEQTFTIDQGALTNVGGDRYKIVAGMALDLQFEGERVATATLIAAKERAALRQAVVLKPEPLDGPRIFSHYCKQCELWILGEPRDGKCGVEAHALS